MAIDRPAPRVTLEDIREIRRLYGRATPGPWFVDLARGCRRVNVGMATAPNQDDAQLISMLHRLGPALLDIAEREFHPPWDR